MQNIHFESSQYVPVEFNLANTGQRMLAALIDYALFIIYFAVVFSFVANIYFFRTNGTSEFLWLLMIKLPWLLYNPLCEYFLRGQTLGKYLVGIRVVTMNGERPKLKDAFMRWMFKGDFLWINANQLVLIWFILGFISIGVISLTKHRQRLADMLANTVVIKTKGFDRFSIHDVLKIKDLSNHEVKYPQVVRFTDEDMMLIKKYVQQIHQNSNDEAKKFGVELCNKTAELLNIKPITSKRLQFLEQVLEDYIVMTR